MQYLDNVTGREHLYEEALKLEQEIFNATTNKEVIKIMNRLTEIVDSLNLSEFPHIAYRANNDTSKI